MRRPQYLEKTLQSLAGLAGLQHLAVYVSQDGNHTGVQEVVQRIGEADLAPPRTKSFTHWQRERIPLLGDKQVGHHQCPPRFAAWHLHALGA